MKTEPQSSPNNIVTSLKVLIAYDSACAGKGAKELCDRLGRRLGSEYELDPCFWNLASFQDPSLAQAAVTDAASAALVIVAVNARRPLSPPARSWLGRCTCRMRVGGSALVAKLHGIIKMEKELSSAYSFLKEVTHNAGVDFFSEVMEPVDDGFDYSIESIHQRAQMRTAVLDSIGR